MHAKGKGYLLKSIPVLKVSNLIYQLLQSYLFPGCARLMMLSYERLGQSETLRLSRPCAAIIATVKIPDIQKDAD